MRPPAITGLDHIPIAVMDLQKSASDYEKLGFSIKFGHRHENGIQNRHIKFADGTELELITAQTAQDDLSALYVEGLRVGEGPVFLGLYAPDTDMAIADTVRAKLHAIHDNGTLTFEGDLAPVFLSRRQKSPTDLPEHFAHANTARSLIGVWYADDNPEPVKDLVSALGVMPVSRKVCVPESQVASVAVMTYGAVTFLPGKMQVVTGHPIAGAVVAVRDIKIAHAVMLDNGLSPPEVITCGGHKSIFLPPSLTHGLWMELRQD